MENLIDEITNSMNDNEGNIWNFDSISFVARLIDKIEETKKVFMDRIDLLCKEQDEQDEKIKLLTKHKRDEMMVAGLNFKRFEESEEKVKKQDERIDAYMDRIEEQKTEIAKLQKQNMDLLKERSADTVSTQTRIIAYDAEITKLGHEIGELTRYNEDFGKLKAKKELRLMEELNVKDAEIEGLGVAADQLSTQLKQSQSEVQLLRLQVETMIKGDILRPQLEADLYIANKQKEELKSQVGDYRNALEKIAFKSDREDAWEWLEQLDQEHGYGK